MKLLCRTGVTSGAEGTVAHDCGGTYTGDVNLTLSIDDEVVQRAQRKAEALGTSVGKLVQDYLEQLSGKADPEADAAEFERLSALSLGNSQGWKFDREELHQRP